MNSEQESRTENTMKTIPKSQNHLAELLGVSKSVVSAQVARGMPTSTLEEAQSWRKSNLDPARAKGLRFDRYHKEAPADFSETEAVWKANTLMKRAEQAMSEGRPLDGLIQQLKSSMSEVPNDQRDNVYLSEAVMRVLLEKILSWLPDPAENPSFADGAPIYCDGASMPEEDAQVSGEIWYGLACGEIPWVAPLEGL